MFEHLLALFLKGSLICFYYEHTLRPPLSNSWVLFFIRFYDNINIYIYVYIVYMYDHIMLHCILTQMYEALNSTLVIGCSCMGAQNHTLEARMRLSGAAKAKAA